MKFFVAFLALAAVAVAVPVKPAGNTFTELEAIVAAIQSPSTDPATAALLEQQLQEILAGVSPIQVGPAIVEQPQPEPIIIGPAIVEEPVYEPISVGPAMIDFPLPEGALTPTPASPPTAPLVQVILNINTAADSGRPPVEVIGAPAAPSEIVPTPVIVVDSAPEVPPTPVQVVDTPIVDPTPVQVVEQAPVAVEPVIIGTPIIPAPAVILPDILN